MLRLGSFSKFVMAGYIALVFSLAMFSGCTKSNPTGPSSSQSDIVPLAMMNTWTYRSIMYSPTDSVLGDAPLSIVVNRDTTISGVHLFSFWGWCAAGDSGLTVYANGYFTLYLKYPVNQGATYYAWGYPVLVSTMDTTLSVPAGSFHCLHYKFYYQNYLNAEYFACPGVGVVKLISYFGSNYPAAASVIQNVQTLASYSLN